MLKHGSQTVGFISFCYILPKYTILKTYIMEFFRGCIQGILVAINIYYSCKRMDKDGELGVEWKPPDEHVLMFNFLTLGMQ